ncbi:ABC transporter B family member 9-like isoform X2 [Carex littledalei]|uniref:ABC transporter B family member 9-like isoform X2 n=1 Tax=Carex littledalei TaxID=544730 RepID=A0A833R6Q0_9POAL|nr:ABC transporter B family member 9-like isoform X2 [Carex littledalei]
MATLDKKETKKNERVPFYKLFAFSDGYDKVLMFVGFVSAIANGLAMPLMTLIFGELIDAFGGTIKDDVVHEVSKIALKFVYLAAGSGVAAFLQVGSWIVAGERQSARIRGLYLKTILKQDIAFFDTETTTGEVIGRMSGDTILIQDAIGEKVGKFLQLVSTFVGGFVISFIKGWHLAIVLLACLPPIAIAGGVMSVLMSKFAARSQLAYTEAGNVVEQTIGAIRTVVSFTGEKKATGKYDNLLKSARNVTVHQGTAAGTGIGTVLLCIFSSYGLAIWYGSRLIIDKGYTGGTIINVIMAIMTGAMSLGQASPCINAFASGQSAAYKMFETIYRKPLIDSYSPDGIVLEHMKGDIELKYVCFTYPARPDQLIFNNFSLFVPHGTTMALVGESGSGKSTVISLVERFYDPQSGEVLVDGVDVKNMKLSWLREQVGLVSQEPILFTTTIRENIEYGKKGATDEEIRRAIVMANAAKFIDKLPNGLGTMVGEHGTQMSGGQKQRIAIARAILKNPKILLLDEATSALDAESEKVVQDALLKIMVNRTTIVVAHRLSTVKGADAISVVHRGKLIEQGSHAELIQNPDGAYSQLIRLQELNAQNEEAVLAIEQKTSALSNGSRSSFERSMSRTSSHSLSQRSSLSLSFKNSRSARNNSDDQEKLGTEIPKNRDVSIKRLACLNKPETPVLLLGTIAAAVHGVILPVFGLLLSTAIKIFFEPPHQLRKDSRFWACIFVLLGAVAFVALPIQYYLFGFAGGKLIERIRSLCFEKIVHQEIAWFDEPSHSSGAIGARLSADAAAIKGLVGDSLALIVQNLATVTAGFVIAMVANWKLALIVICILPFIGAQGYAQMMFLKGFSGDAKKKYEEASTVANDAVGSIRTVASFCAEKRVLEAYEKKCAEPVKQGVRQGLVSGIGYGFAYMLLYCSYALCFYVGALFVHKDKATFSQVFRVFFALTMAAVGVSNSSALGPDMNKAKDSAASVFEFLDRKSKIDSSNDTGRELANLKGEIELKHVAFRYPNRPNVEIFRDLCLKMPAGKTVALVGESGSGKSTVIALLERFYDPDSGSIFLDGCDLKSFKLNWLRQQMGLVGQEPVLFNESIGANIAYGKEGQVTQEEIVAAAIAANAHGFISALSDGYNTNVGERGLQMSGGQKQRIAIARAILKDPRILLLDEATSALDTESERVVQEALDNVMVGRTTVVVAHRLSTISGAHKIAVVKDGVIAEQGRHEDLIQISDGAYASLVALHSSSG